MKRLLIEEHIRGKAVQFSKVVSLPFPVRFWPDWQLRICAALRTRRVILGGGSTFTMADTDGQCVLMARRLLEHGVPFVSVNWHNDGRNFWDTHGNNFHRLKNDLIPPSDQALAAVLTDLRDRGMLDDTLVVWVGEFGRRPQISANNAGREHHPFCYSGLMAGGGIKGGSIYGASDEIAKFPSENPMSPRDLVATMLHALGVPAATTLNDLTGRPHGLYGGNPVLPLFG